MANQAFSRSDDLMVGAGVLYFQRSDDPHGWHHLGNVEEFTINNNIETIEKNSSMNKKRELMARVVTSVQPQGSITMNEYNPYNLALGLYGTEGVHHQALTAIQNQAYVVNSVPGVVTVVDGNGERYMDIRNVTIAPATPTTPSATFDTANQSFDYDPTNTEATYNATNTGGVIKVNVGSASPTTDQTVYVSVTPSTTDGDVDGATIYVKVGLSGPVVSHAVTSTGSTASWTLNSATDGASVAPVNGMTIEVELGSGDQFGGTSDPVSGASGAVINVLAPITTYESGKDYVLDAQELRAGVIKIKSGGHIKEGDTILVTCTVPEKDFITVSGSDAGEIEGKLLFIGDPNIGGQYNIEGWKVKVTPDGDLTGLIGTDFGSYNLTVSFLSDYENHPDYPYFKATFINRSSGTDSVDSDYDPEY